MDKKELLSPAGRLVPFYINKWKNKDKLAMVLQTITTNMDDTDEFIKLGEKLNKKKNK